MTTNGSFGKWLVVLAIVLVAGCGDNGEATDPVATTFTRADHGRCGNFPMCPDGIVGNPDQYKLRVLPEQCRADFNWAGSCGACVDTRTAACAPFVGSCVAPNWPQHDVDFCQNRVAAVNQGGAGWTICTGEAQDLSGNAQLVCED